MLKKHEMSQRDMEMYSRESTGKQRTDMGNSKEDSERLTEMEIS